MADGNEDGRHPSLQPPGQDQPTRPASMPQSLSWPDSAYMPAQNQAATRQFQANSERLQHRHEQTAKAQSQEQTQANKQQQALEARQLAPGDYGGLRRETAKGQRETIGQQRQQPAEGTLSFTRDRRKADREQTTQRPEAKEGELSFMRDRAGRDLSRGR